MGGTLFFRVDDGVHGYELWRSDGTETGTVLVKDIRPGTSGGTPVGLTRVGGTVFFTVDDGVHGAELWRSDGTETGTVLVKDIRSDADYSYPSDLTGVGGTLFFRADDGVHGDELWRSDGTETGTVLVRDINAGGGFRVADHGTAQPRTGTMRVRVHTEGAGRLVVRPAGGSLLQKGVRDVASARDTTATLRPTRAGMRQLEKTGSLRVRARFTFTPCDGPGSSVVKAYTLKLTQ